MSNLDSFRLETRDWLEDNCPETMRKPMKTADDGCWGGRNFTFKSEDQKLWMDRMGEKVGQLLNGQLSMVGVG